MIKRRLERKLLQWAGQYPVVTVTGPRQSGKTTLCRAVFSDKPYFSLEDLDNRDYARKDPRGFLSEISMKKTHRVLLMKCFMPDSIPVFMIGG